MFSSYIDSSRPKAIQETHGVDNFTFKIRPLLFVIEDIISLTNRGDFPDIRGNRIGFFSDVHLDNKTSMVDEEMTLKINQISWEILGNVWGGSNVQDRVFEILKSVSSFFWAGKGVIALAAFAVNYGELWLVNQLQHTNPVAQSLALVDQLPTQMENKGSMFREMAKLIMAVLNLIKCITESVDVLEHKYVDPDKPWIKDMIAQIPEHTYWIIRGIVTCQSRLSNLDESEPFETEIVDKITELGRSMRKQLDLCYLQIEQRRIEVVYGKIKKLIEITSNPDSVQILKALISEEEDMPLYNGHTKELVKIDTLRKKVTLLYITAYPLKNLEVELSFLSEMYQPNDPTKYEIVWFPMVEAGALSPETKLELKNLQSRMPWLSFRDVSLLDPAVVKYMKEDLQFEKRSMIKVLDAKGRLMKNHDAMNMVFIWGNLAFPFNEQNEASLWAKTDWGVDLLLNFVVPSAKEWVDEGRLVCMYGGNDTGWIQQFTTAMSDTSHLAKKQMMMLDMGMNKRNEVMNNTNIGDTSILTDSKKNLFWTRLESMWYSRVQIGAPQESDEIITEVFKMVSFEHSGRGWAIVAESGKMAKGMGDTMLKALLKYDQWKENVEKGFVSALEEYMMRSITSTSPFRNILMLPKTKIGLPEKMECFECKREMKRSIQFSCCGD